MFENYTLHKVDPFNFSYAESLQVAEVAVQAFQHTGLFRFFHGSNYEFGNDYNIVNQSITDPRTRLNTIVQRTKRYRELVHAWACMFKKEFLHLGMEVWLLYDNDRLVSLILWELPISMRKRSFWQNLQAWCVTKYYELWEGLTNYFHFDHPIKNNRLPAWLNFERNLVQQTYPETEQVLLAKTREELESVKCVYPKRNQYLYLNLLAVSPYYQRQGIGKKLILNTLEQIGDGDTVIPVGNEQLVVPQKIYIRSTPEAYKLYQNLNFMETICVNTPWNFKMYGMQQLRSQVG